MSLSFDCLVSAGFDVETGFAYTGGEERYLSALQRFYRSYGKMSAAIAESEKSEDLEAYTRNVHSLKSNSMMIGANELSEKAKLLEQAGRDGDLALIHAETPALAALHARCIDTLRPFGEMERVRVAGEISGAEARLVGKELLTALDDFDDDRAAGLLNTLSGYPFRLTQKNLLNDARDHIENFEYDEALDLIKTILEQIED